MNQLDQLKKMTTIVIDTGDLEAIKNEPTDATTNPSLVLQAVQKSQYRHLIEEAVTNAKYNLQSNHLSAIIDNLSVNLGKEILKVIPGRVSTEIDARLSFDTKKSIAKAESIIQLYEKSGISRDRILIKLASTWEGIKAAQQLEKKGIHCNMTLIFGLPQAIQCAKAKVTLISPFVGRILDWYKKNEGLTDYSPEQDPGVRSVKEIYNYLKKYGYNTQIMGASFRSKEQILELAGCDLLTISPSLLEELKKSTNQVACQLNSQYSQSFNGPKMNYTENSFRWSFNDDAMAVEKLSEGIRLFAKDTVKLEKFIISNFTL